MASLGQKFKKHSVETKKKILDSYYSGSHSVLELAKMYKISHKTIENWINKTNNGKNVLETKKSPGRPKKVTDYKQRYEIVKKMEKFLKQQEEIKLFL